MKTICAAFASYVLLSQPFSRSEFIAPTTLLEKKVSSNQECSPLEVLFLVDSTGSMGLYARDISEEILQSTLYLSTVAPVSRFALSTITDFDFFDEDQVQNLGNDPMQNIVPFTSNLQEIVKGVSKLGYFGGGDFKEAYAYGLDRASDFEWGQNTKKVVVLFADSKDHDNNELAIVANVAPYRLITVTPASSMAYWMQYSDKTILLGVNELQKELNSLIEECAKRKVCNSEINKVGS